MHEAIERLLERIDPVTVRRCHRTLEREREPIRCGSPEDLRAIDGSVAFVAREGQRVRMARSLGHPLRHLPPRRPERPAPIVADRIAASPAPPGCAGPGGQDQAQ